jgi:hypothetical protein
VRVQVRASAAVVGSSSTPNRALSFAVTAPGARPMKVPAPQPRSRTRTGVARRAAVRVAVLVEVGLPQARSGPGCRVQSNVANAMP